MSCPYDKAHANAGEARSVLHSLRQFDKLELKGLYSIESNPRADCFLGTYYRTAANVDSLLAMESPQHFQAAAMIARSLFEFAVEIKLIDKVDAGWAKMFYFGEVERLRAAREMIEFAKNNPGRTQDVTSQTEWVTQNADRIEHNRRRLWPPTDPSKKLPNLRHWSEPHLSRRVTMLGEPFDAMYKFYYPRLSWYVHSGLTGIQNLEPAFVPTVQGFALSLSFSCYEIILDSVIREMRLNLADTKLLSKLKYAGILPLAETPERADEMFRALLGD